MNKKFSTLMASVLLATAFSSSAWAAGDPFANVKTGEHVALKATKALVIKNGVVEESTNTASTLLGNIANSDKDNVAANFKALDAAIWNVEVIENVTSAGVVRTYRFANKVTGEYLAYKLATDGSVDAVATKLDQTGNKTWAVDGNGALYAFVPASGAKKDSTYYLSSEANGFKLKVVAGKPGATISGATALGSENLSTTPLTMNAAIFNYIMGKNDGKLHFNGGKDVSSNETNVLTAASKWTAEDFVPNLYIALTNGKTKSGYTNDLETDADGNYIKINKKEYLMVDTTYQDYEKKYFKLKTDTVPAEPYEAGSNYAVGAGFNATVKTNTIQNQEMAGIKAEYYYANDSISLKFIAVPKEIGGTGKFSQGGKVAVDYTQSCSTPSAAFTNNDGAILLRKLGNGMVLTVPSDGAISPSVANPQGFTFPLVQPYAKAASAGDAVIDTKSVVYSLQVAGEKATLRATSMKGAYLISKDDNDVDYSTEIDGSNVYAQWAFIEGAAGTYRIVNRATEAVYYVGAVSILKDAKGNKVADTYVMGNDTVKIAKVDLSGANIVTEGTKQYDYSAAYFAGDATGLTQAFSLNPVSPFMSALAMQYVINNGDTTLVLADADEAPVWQLEQASNKAFGLEIDGLPRLKKATYRIFTKDDEDNKYYVQVKDDEMILKNANQFNDDADGVTTFEFVTTVKDQYVVVGSTAGANDAKMTINPTPAKPILEASPIDDLRTDLFTINKAEAGIYRTLTAEDGVLGNAAIYMENEPSRYLYENTQNIVANNGNKVAKDSLNFLGIFNAFELDKNPTVYVDTAWVNRKGNWMPQYMFGLNVQEVEAVAGTACTEAGPHFDKNGNKVDAAHCVHATQGKAGYKTGRYLMSLTDSVPANVKNTPVKYDNQVRLAFIDATIYPGQDSIIVNNSKYTGTKNAKNDTLKIADKTLNPATFALRIADQETQSFYLETVKDAAGKEQYVRILNGVPVLTADIKDAAIFNIEASELEATANEAIEASEVVVIGGQGVVTVQGAAGKVVTVANILGQTIANQVAASDNVTIAVPAGIVVVAVDGEATKVVVK